MSLSPLGANLPLSRFERVHTRDVDQARHVVASAFCPHRLTALDRAAQFETRFHAVATREVSLCYLDYGGRVHIAPEEQQTFYLILIPLAGGAHLSHGREHAQYDSSAASVPPVDRAYTIRVGAGSPHLVVRIARERLEEHLSVMLARSVSEPLRFSLRIDMTTPAVRSWRKVVDLLLDEIDSGGQIPAQPLAMRELERLLLSQLLLAQPNNYSALLHEQPRNTALRTIRRAVELMEERAADPLTSTEIAQSVGLGVRSLQEGFRRYLDTTPRSQLREIRLLRIREELTSADPTSTTVTAVAARWGLPHPGHFSVAYRRRFGESPSATLRGRDGSSPSPDR